MNFEVFEAMYAMFWEFIYKVLAIFEIDLENPYADEEADA